MKEKKNDTTEAKKRKFRVINHPAGEFKRTTLGYMVSYANA